MHVLKAINESFYKENHQQKSLLKSILAFAKDGFQETFLYAIILFMLIDL
jgi:hypothetical protein